MRKWTTCVLAAGCVCIGGCGKLVGKKEYLATSMSPALSARAEVAPVRAAPDYSSPIPREGLRLPDLYDGDEVIDANRTVVRHTRQPASLATGVYLQLHLLRMDLVRLSGLADQHGGLGRATFDSHVRRFNTSAQLIERCLSEFRTSDPGEWKSLQDKIDVHLQDARHAVREADQNIRRVHDRGHLLTSAVSSIQTGP